MYPVEPIGGGTAPTQISGASSRQRCGNDGQRKRVAHMPTATTTKEDSRSKLVQNHPHDFTKKPNFEGDNRQRSGHEQNGFEWMPLLVFCLVILALGVGAVYTAMA